jgi:hypothetical protein
MEKEASFKMINKTIEIQIRNMKSGKEIDEMISDRVFGEKFRKPTHGTCCTCQTCGWDYDNCLCGWSTETEKAWDVLEKMGDSFIVDHSAPDFGITVTIFNGKGFENSKATADTFELAVCKAALIAKFSEE